MKKSRKRVLSLAISFALVLTFLPGFTLPARAAADTWDGTTIASGFAGGSGTAADPWQIATGAQLAYLAQEVNTGNMSGKYFLLTADIDLGGYEWTPIGSDARPFNGSFDGGGHTVSGLSIEDAHNGYVGLFGWIFMGGSVQNLRVEGTINITGATGAYNNYVGGIVGENRGTILNCSSAVAVNVSSGGNDYNTAGSLAGDNVGWIANCYATGDATASGGTLWNDVGGLTGYNDGNIENCYATGSATSSGIGENTAGGLVGDNYYGDITNCYATGGAAATGGTDNRAGGLAGRNYDTNGATITNGYYSSANTSKGVGEGDASDVTGLTRAQMTGDTALNNMVFTAPADWVATANTGSALYYPQLAVFANGSDAQQADSLLSVTVKLTAGSVGSGTTTYTVSFEANGGGAVAGQTINSGGNAAKPADPEKSGFTFAGWYTDAALTQAFDFNTQITKNITLYAKWTEKTEEAWINPFSDVKTDDWFYGDVEYAVTNGLFSGTTATQFDPNAPMTRGMLVTVLGRLYGVDTSEYAGSSFDDVAEGQYYAPYVEWARQNEIVNGVGDNRFAPDLSVSRQDMAAILLRCACFIGRAPSGEWAAEIEYVDIEDIADYALEGVIFCTMNGIVSGKPGSVFDPLGGATRAEVAAMLHRFAEAFSVSKN